MVALCILCIFLIFVNFSTHWCLAPVFLTEQCLNGSGFTSSSHIYLRSRNLSNLGDNLFRKCKELAYLFLSKNCISRVSNLAFTGTNIELLDLSSNKLVCIPNIAVLTHSLKVFYITNNLLYRCRKGHIYNIQFSKLNTIFLSYNDLKDLSAMTVLLVSPNLKHIVLEGNKLNQLENIHHLLPHLTQLNLWDNPMSCYCGAWWIRFTTSTRLMCIPSKNGGPLSGLKLDPVFHHVVNQLCDKTGKI